MRACSAWRKQNTNSQLQPLLAFMCQSVCVCVGAEGGDNQEVFVKVITQGRRLTARVTVILQSALPPLQPVPLPHQ